MFKRFQLFGGVVYSGSDDPMNFGSVIVAPNSVIVITIGL